MPINSENEISAMIQAINENDLTSVQNFMLIHPEWINVPGGDDDSTPLIIAATQGREKIVEYLLEKNADVMKRNCHGLGALELSFKSQQFETGQLIFNKIQEQLSSEAKTESDVSFYEGVTQLWLRVAYAEEPWDIVQQALSNKDWDVLNRTPQHDEHTGKGISVLWWAAFRNRWDIVVKILKARSDVDINATPQHDEHTGKGISVLWRAAVINRWDIVVKILKARSDVDINATPQHDKHINKGISVLWWAALKDLWDMVAQILENHPKVDINATPQHDKHINKGISVLWWAAFSNRWDIVAKILENHPKVDINAAPQHDEYTHKGISVLWFAAFSDRWDIVAKILENHPKVDINAAPQHDEHTHKGTSVLEMLIEKNQWELIFFHSLLKQQPMENLDLIEYIKNTRGGKKSLTFENIKDLNWKGLLNSVFKARSLNSLAGKIPVLHALIRSIFQLTYFNQTTKLEHLTSIIKTLVYVKLTALDIKQEKLVADESTALDIKQEKLVADESTALDIKQEEDVIQQEYQCLQRNYEMAVTIFSDNPGEFTVDDLLDKAIYFIAHEVAFPQASFIDSLQDAKQEQFNTDSLEDDRQTEDYKSYLQALDLLEEVKKPSEEEYRVLREHIARGILSQRLGENYLSYFLMKKQNDPQQFSQQFLSKADVLSFVGQFGSEYAEQQLEKKSSKIRTQAAKITQLESQLAKNQFSEPVSVQRRASCSMF